VFRHVIHHNVDPRLLGQTSFYDEASVIVLALLSDHDGVGVHV